MSWSRLLLLPLVAAVPLLVAGALRLPSNDDVPPRPAPVFPVCAAPAAVQALQEAIAALAPERVQWIKTDLWQKASSPPLAFEANGLYLSGPNHRLRLDLQVRQETSRSRVLMVSDGQTLWQVAQTVGQPRTVSRMDLARVLASLHRPGASAEARQEFYRNQFFLGLAPLLADLRDNLTFTRGERVHWRKQDVILLTGVWSSQPAEWQESFPRQCRLFLDARTRWPHRLEWWGPLPHQTGDSLLLQMEFRNPRLNQPLADTLFTFQPGKSPVTDLTVEWTKR